MGCVGSCAASHKRSPTAVDLTQAHGQVPFELCVAVSDFLGICRTCPRLHHQLLWDCTGSCDVVATSSMDSKLY